MNSNIRNIIFDWGGVLLDLDVEGCIRAFEKAGATHIKELLNGTNELGVFKDYECGKIDTPAFRKEICQLIGTELPDAEIDRLWNSELLSIPQKNWNYYRAYIPVITFTCSAIPTNCIGNMVQLMHFSIKGKTLKTVSNRFSYHSVWDWQNPILPSSVQHCMKPDYLPKKLFLLMMQK